MPFWLSVENRWISRLQNYHPNTSQLRLPCTSHSPYQRKSEYVIVVFISFFLIWETSWSCLPKDRLFNERIYFLSFKYILKLIQNKQIVTHSHVRMLWFRMRPSIFIITWVYLFRCWQNITNVLDVFFVRFKEVCTFACLRFIYGKSFTFTLRKPVCLRFFFCSP